MGIWGGEIHDDSFLQTPTSPRQVGASSEWTPATAERVEALLVKNERGWLSRNESISWVFLEAGGAGGFHPVTGGVGMGRE